MIKKWFKNNFAKKTSQQYNDWRTENSILHFLYSHLDVNGKLTDDANTLPDERKNEHTITFAPGLKDALLGAVDESEGAKNRIDELIKNLKKIANHGDKESDAKFYKLITDNENVIGIIDNFIVGLGNTALPIEPYLINYAKDLIRKSNHRNAVKFGIAILGKCQDPTVLNDIKILGLHDEFTVFSTIAIANLSHQPIDDLWNLAKKVDGWGKIQLVDRLVNENLSPSIKDWLVLEGYKNNIMHEYLAYTCALYGELHIKLERDQIDHQLYRAASEIIEALLSDQSPSEDITSYPFAAKVIQGFIKHTPIHATNVSDFYVLQLIHEYLNDLLLDFSDQAENGWTQDIISNLLIETHQLIKRRDWSNSIYEGLKSEDKNLYWHAKQMSLKLGIDMSNDVWAKLKSNPAESIFWYDVTHYSKPEQADQIIDFALIHLPLNEISLGVNGSMGSKMNHHVINSLDYITTFLEKYPGKGEQIILAMLNCPVLQIRNMVIHTLKKWNQENWTPEILTAVQKLSEIEPNVDTRESVRKLLENIKRG